jgi:hypothetical protein
MCAPEPSRVGMIQKTGHLITTRVLGGNTAFRLHEVMVSNRVVAQDGLLCVAGGRSVLPRLCVQDALRLPLPPRRLQQLRDALRVSKPSVSLAGTAARWSIGKLVLTNHTLVGLRRLPAGLSSNSSSSCSSSTRRPSVSRSAAMSGSLLSTSPLASSPEQSSSRGAKCESSSSAITRLPGSPPCSLGKGGRGEA